MVMVENQEKERKCGGLDGLVGLEGYVEDRRPSICLTLS